jgi:hypothetical protein
MCRMYDYVEDVKVEKTIILSKVTYLGRGRKAISRNTKIIVFNIKCSDTDWK